MHRSARRYEGSWRRRPAAVALLLCAAAAGCGGGAGTPRSATSHTTSDDKVTLSITTKLIPPGQHVRGDGDADNPGDIDGNGDSDVSAVGGPDNDSDAPTPGSYRLPDSDDRETFAYGHPPSAAAKRAIESVVHRYYAAAAGEDGAVACPLIQPQLVRTLPEDNAGPREPAYVRGRKTCPAIMTALFTHYHEELSAPIDVVEVRVEGAIAQVIVASRTLRAGNTFVERRDGKWMFPRLFSSPLT